MVAGGSFFSGRILAIDQGRRIAGRSDRFPGDERFARWNNRTAHTLHLPGALSGPTLHVMMRASSIVVFLAGATGCSFANDSGDTARSCQSLTVTQATPMPAFTGSVFTIAMENHTYGDIIGNSDAPYINGLAKEYTAAKGYHDPFVHPSEPNYLWMTAGENFDVLDDNDPSSHHLTSTSHIADQLELAELSWKAYEESMGSACGLRSQGRYAAKHDPFVYYDDVNGWDGKQFNPSPRCTEHVVDYSELAADIAEGTLPKYGFITPNLDDDMHDGSIADGDAWLSRELPQLLATSAFQNGGVVFLLWDEGSFNLFDGGIQDDPPFIAISPMAKAGYLSTTDYDTSSYLKTVETILGLDLLPCGKGSASVPVMSDLFTVTMPQD
jgi:hypothetical protein